MPFFVPKTSSLYKKFVQTEFNEELEYDLLFQILSLYYISMKQCNIFKKNSAYTLKMNIETILRKKPLPSNLKKKIVFI